MIHSQSCTPRVYVEIGDLDPELYPCHVTRVLGVTTVSISEGARRSDVALFFADHLSPAEQTVVRLAYDCPAYGQPVADHWLDGVVDPVVPDAVAWPWQRARRAA